MAYVTLDSIVRDAAEEDGGLHLYARYLKYAMRIVKEISYDTLASPITVILRLDAAGRVDMPVDYVTYLKTGTLNSRGYINVLGLNNNMADVQQVNDCGDMEKNIFIGENKILEGYGHGYRFNNYWDGNCWGTLFGFGGGHNRHGYFKEIESTRQIQVSSEVTGYLVLEYISNGLNRNGATRVDERATETILAGISWRSKLNKRNIGAGEKQMFKQLFDEEHEKLRARLFAFTLEEIKEAVSVSYMQAPKH